MPTSLVTGGAGFIGSHLVDALLERGDDVRVLDNLTTGNLKNLHKNLDNLEFIDGDIRKPADLKQALNGADLVYHQAAFVSVPLSLEKSELCLDVNVQGTRQLLELSKQAGVNRVILASSAAVYGDNQELPLSETGRTNPQSPYASSKLINEIFARMYTYQLGLDVVALRYFNVFGPRQNPESNYAAVIPIFVNHLVNKTPPVIFGDGKQSRDFVFVADVAQANILAASVPDAPGKVINICSGVETSILDLLGMLSRIFNQSIDPIFDNPRLGDIYRSLGDPALAQDLLSFFPKINMIDGLRNTANWMIRSRGKDIDLGFA